MIRRRLAWTFAVLALVALGAALAGWWYLQRSLPRLDGEASVKGLAGPVEIVRDAEGIPHVFATAERDGWFALGYAHAQDRLWQMEFQRRVAQGRLAEILGERAYDTDRLMRTLGIARVAERITSDMEAESVAALEAYAAGVNAFLASGPVLPVEFQVFGIVPEPWRPADSMGWMLVMAWDLSGNWRAELGRLRFAAQIQDPNEAPGRHRHEMLAVGAETDVTDVRKTLVGVQGRDAFARNEVPECRGSRPRHARHEPCVR